jgi:outer membrane protein assembly factor BamB
VIYELNQAVFFIPMEINMFKIKSVVFILIILFLISNLNADDWSSWRGPNQNGTSSAENMISDWSINGTNLIWKSKFTGRSTPVVHNGRVYVIGRLGEGIDKQEVVACYNAENGQLIWEYKYNLRNTSIPFNRVGWASVTIDPESGNVYSIGTGAIFHCFDQDGKILWMKSMVEDYGARTGYGGRTTTAVIDEDLVILGFVSAGWGNQKPMKHRHFAFNKYNGSLVWASTPGNIFKTPNIHSVPFVCEINGQRLLIAGNSDGFVYAMQARTGKKVWGFQLSKRGINSSIVVDGYRVYAAHGEENVDSGNMGRIVCIDGRGEGDITKTNELWRHDDEVGFGSPLIKDGRVYYIDSSSNLLSLDGETGKLYWEHSIGTVGKSSPVWADGKIYATEVNGLFHIIKPEDDGCKILDTEKITFPDGRYAEIYASPAIAYERIYFTTEEGLYCLGDESKKIQVTESKLPPDEDDKSMKGAVAAQIQIRPAEVIAASGKEVQFSAHAFDSNGNYIEEIEVDWQIKGVDGQFDGSGKLNLNSSNKSSAGEITASSGDISGDARIRVFPNLPWQENFEGLTDGSNPGPWIGTSTNKSPANRFIVKEDQGNKVLVKPVSEKGIQRGFVFIGPADMKNYIIQADVKDQKYKRKRGDAGLISHGYELDLMGKRQRLQIRSWISELRVEETIPFKWEPEVWYSIKLQVDQLDNKAVIMGKVWPKGQTEPEEWTITTEDPHPIRFGSPGLYGVSYTEVSFDNVIVTEK